MPSSSNVPCRTRFHASHYDRGGATWTDKTWTDNSTAGN
jgi:hypothetical protein